MKFTVMNSSSTKKWLIHHAADYIVDKCIFQTRHKRRSKTRTYTGVLIRCYRKQVQVLQTGDRAMWCTGADLNEHYETEHVSFRLDEARA